MKNSCAFLLLVLLSFFSLHLSAQAPYTIRLQVWDTAFAPALQSFCAGSYQGKLLVVGGRTNGFHRTSDAERTFPTRMANQKIWVIDIQGKKSWSAPVPSSFLSLLRATNMESYQDNEVLYCCGGYGSVCDNDSASCYQTFPNLTAIDVPGIVQAIVNGQTTGLERYMTTIRDERMRVTGGSLEKIGDYFYLVFGHNYNSIYKGGITGIYTEQVRKFRITNNAGNLTISDYSVISTPLQFQGLSQFHRRDLNIMPAILPDGSTGIQAYGGVFTNQGGPFPNPVAIAQTGVQIDTGFRQKFCLYDCAKILLYDPARKNMYTTLLGGITDYYYDASGKITPSNMNNFMPFFDHCNTIQRDAQGRYNEYPQFTPSLPGFIGSNALFLPAPYVPHTAQLSSVIDYSKLPADSVPIGWMYGGIMATAPQSNEFNPTYSSKTIYAVYLKKNNMPNSANATYGVTDSTSLQALNYKEAVLHPENLYAQPSSGIWEVLGWIMLGSILVYMLWLFAKSALCRSESFDERGSLRPVRERPFSYGRTQLFWWTLIIVFCYGLFFVMFGILLPLNTTTVLLLGGPLAVFVMGRTIDNSQIKANNETVPARHQDQISQGFLTDILSDDGGISVHRLQAIAFNLIYGIGFLQYFFEHVADKNYPFIQFEPWQLSLLGVSAAGYLGLKANENNEATLPKRANMVVAKKNLQVNANLMPPPPAPAPPPPAPPPPQPIINNPQGNNPAQ